MQTKILDKGPGSIKSPIVSKKTQGYRESKTRFGKVHEYLIKVGIIDGSQDSLVADILDEKLTNIQAVDLIMSKIKGVKSVHSRVEKLVYIALGGVFKLEISMRIRAAMDIHYKELNKALKNEDYDIGYSLIKGERAEITEEDLIKAINMRIRAIKAVVRLHGSHFFKRAYHVSDGWKIPLVDIRKNK